MRLCEFTTSCNKLTDGLHLYAWAKYRRGDVATTGEYAYINNRVLAKHPRAELVSMSRRFVPNCGPDGVKEPTEVWWEFKWIVFKAKEGAKG